MILLAIFLFFIAPVYAHDHWINHERLTDPKSGEWCCNEKDCDPEPVTPVSGGYQVSTGEIIPHARIIWRSPDGQWWRCRYLLIRPDGVKTRCLIGPIPNT